VNVDADPVNGPLIVNPAPVSRSLNPARFVRCQPMRLRLHLHTRVQQRSTIANTGPRELPSRRLLHQSLQLPQRPQEHLKYGSPEAITDPGRRRATAVAGITAEMAKAAARGTVELSGEQSVGSGADFFSAAAHRASSTYRARAAKDAGSRAPSRE
jgi:hypothetical protein